MNKLSVTIERKDLITLEIELPEGVSVLEAYDKISSDPGDYLEKHIGNVVKESVQFNILGDK